MVAKSRQRRKRHVHLDDIPKRLFPRNSKAGKYRDELTRMLGVLWFVNHRVQHAAQICAFDIKSITTKNGFRADPREVLDMVRDFTYHYENFCSRVYSIRDKLLQFLNAVLPIGFTETEVRYRLIIMQPVIKHSKLLVELERFGKRQALGGIITDRNSLTHKLYYGERFDHYYRPIEPTPNTNERFKKWKTEILERATKANKSFKEIIRVTNNVAGKVIDWKEQAKNR